MKLNWSKRILFGFQHTLAMFGATVLVPFLTGLDISVALFTAGAGTLLFHALTKKEVPVFLGSSFAFIPAILSVKAMYATPDDPNAGLPYATGGIIIAGLIYVLAGGLIKLFGSDIMRKLLPPVVIGPIIITIGLTLTPVAYDMAKSHWGVALISMLTVALVTVFGKGIYKNIPILFGVGAGYAASLIFKLVDAQPILDAKVVALPNFMAPKFSMEAIAVVAPIALVTMVEHLGDITTIGATVGDDFITEPGLHRTLLGDGLATCLAGLIGGPANTTYGENTGVIAVTKVYEPAVLRVAAVIAILMSILGKFGAVLSTIPEPVMGGISIILFGMIASVGMRVMVENKIDFSSGRNMLIAAFVLTLGMMSILGENNPAVIDLGFIQLEGLSLATIVGITLNLILPEEKPESK
ncbi:MAG: uracil-xanthine permease family protein [Bacillota bacterium]|jgi:uracil permease|nr:uracil-xanthine permease [Candidatus Fermentithermobacillaceae bacterium]HOP70989.1 uracil-xanthine permease family protein [Bacillota bacterium]HPT35291.1 uracil-xanthine permease family protein [Bacillota bacterium]HQD85904.1 uracil-xanthine permease family protein [Bacillota bacterium]